MNKFEKREICKKSKNFSRWYTDVILNAQLADYSPVKGCMVIRPYGYSLWEKMKSILDRMIKDAGVQNAYFPIFIPESFLAKEKEHVKGFSPELAVVTIGGGKELEEKLIVRPTSETIMYNKYSDWIQSWRDLPLKINQWCNIVRWEKRTYFFLRTTEFLWQEGHTAHATHKEAKKETQRALKMYKKFFQKYLALPGISGKKSPYDKFPGAINTFAYESLMPTGKALQSCTSHDLGQNFSKAFDINFQDKNSNLKYTWQTCWGLSTRAIGGLIMVHGDDAGLNIPPKIAPIQVIIIPILKTNSNKNKKILQNCEKIKEVLKKANIRTKVDNRLNQTPGYKFNEWELKGIPLRIEIGEKEIQQGNLKLVKRISQGQKEKLMAISGCQRKIKKELNKIHLLLYQRAEKYLKQNTHKTAKWEKFKKIMADKKGFINAFWCGKKECEQKIKKQTKASTRCLHSKSKKTGNCILCGAPCREIWTFAQAY